MVGPHGAGFVFAAFLPQNSCMIELFPDLEDLGFICYARLAFLQNVNYWQFTLGHKSRCDLSLLKSALEKCVSVQMKH